MAIFGRKNEEEIEDEDEFAEEGEGSSRKFTKKFRDLNPANKKKRKEPPKPWGKKERILVLIILLITVIISVILTLGTKDKIAFKLSLPKFDFSSLNIFREETIIVGNK